MRLQDIGLQSLSFSEQEKVLRRKAKFRLFLQRALAYTILSILAFIFMLPLIWMISTSLKTRWEVMTWPPQFIPSNPQWHNYVDALTRYPFGRFMLNTLILVVLNVVGELISVPLVAFGFARLRFPGKRPLFILLLATMILPSQVKMIPLFWMYSKLNMVNTYWPLFLPSFFGTPFFIFLMVQYMKTIPLDYDDAARIDGATTWDILYRIILPLCVPPLTVIVVFTFLWTWNAFLDPLIYLNDFQKFTVSLGLAMFRGRYSVEWNLFMAATMVTILPVLVVYFFAQDKLIGGISSVGLKG